jgi:hypothetical protein
MFAEYGSIPRAVSWFGKIAPCLKTRAYSFATGGLGKPTYSGDSKAGIWENKTERTPEHLNIDKSVKACRTTTNS